MAAPRYVPEPEVMLADNAEEAAPIPAIRPRTLGGNAEILLASAEEPTQRVVPTFAVTAPIPVARSADGGLTIAALAEPVDASAYAAVGAPMPLVKSERLQLATRGTIAGETAVAALEAMDAPQPRVLMSPRDNMVTAYVPTSTNEGPSRPSR